MPSHPLSLRKTRQAVSATIKQTNAQAKVLAQTVGQVNKHSAFLRQGLWGRLRWVLFGLPGAPSRGGE